MSDDKAKDILDTLVERRQAGELTHERVGRRRVSGPGSERRSRLFQRLGMADPYDPDAEDRPLALGPVALKLTGKREPAPHAKVRPRQTAKDPSDFRPKVAPAPSPKPQARAQGKDQPKAPPPQAGDAAPPPGPSGAPRLPVRPDAEGGPPRPPVPKRPAFATQEKEKRAGRFRLQRTGSSGPKERKVETNRPLVEPVEEAAPEQPKGRGGNNMGLDDLFGFAGEGRLRRPRSSDKEKE